MPPPPIVPPPGRGPLFIDPEATIKAALRGLGVEQVEATRCITEMLAWLNGITSTAELRRGIREHPLRKVSIGPGNSTHFSLPRFPAARGQKIAEAILAKKDALGGAFSDIVQVAAIPDVDELVLVHLIHVGCELAHQAPSGPVIGVMLPLRIETRFSPPTGASSDWTMRLRVIPDAPSIDRHLSVPTKEELDALETMWVNANSDLSTDVGNAQWRRFAAQVGPARAAWLARSFPAQVSGGIVTINRPATTRTDHGTSRISGFPPTIEIWVARGGGGPTKAIGLTVDRTKLALDFPDPNSNETRWWMSFQEAKAVGLGAEINLGPTRPDDIDAVYAIGIGDLDPAVVFADHRDAGALGLIAPGSPTNTVVGEPAADLARDPEIWRKLLLSLTAQSGAEAVSAALTGRMNAITPLPGGDRDDVQVNAAMVCALWSVLWGHGLKDVWGLGDQSFPLGLWAAENLLPEGPLPAIRIGNQPYGLLPATSLRRWVTQPGDPGVESKLTSVLRDARRNWAAAASAAGTSVGADTDRLLDLIGRVPVSRAYAWRWAVPLEAVHAITWSTVGGATWSNLTAWWNDLASFALAFGQPPARRYSTLGWPQDLDLPLVQPDNLPPNMTLEDAIKRIASWPPSQFASEGGLRELFPKLPNSLLLRLLIHAALVNAAEVARASRNMHGPMLDPITFDEKIKPVIAQWGQQFLPSMLSGDPSTELFQRGREGTFELASVPVATLERVLRATLDTAMYRIDPWVIGIAWRRLRTLSAATPAPQFRLGVYGWVDSPRPRSSSALPDEFLHAPSEAQALTSAIMRDRALYDAEPTRWQMDLESDGVRLAESLAREVRTGVHLSEAVGRAVERAVGESAKVESLRARFPIRTEHAGRRTCDGLAIVARYASNPSSLMLSTVQLAAIGEIAEAIDTYGDLLVADAVHDVVSGRAALAGAAMEAAAGLGAPPNLDVVRTQRCGRAVTSTVLIALPDGTTPTTVDTHTSPGRLAEPAVADALVSLTGTAAHASWTWTVHDANNVVIATVALSDLGLEPIDTLSLAPSDLVGLVLDRQPGHHVTPASLDAHVCVRRLADILGSQPAAPADLTVNASNPSSAAVQAEVLVRYTALHALAITAQATLVMAQGAIETIQRVALQDAAKWGITPMQVDAASMRTRLIRAAEALADRIAKAPSVADATNLSLVPLARAMAELVSPEGRLPVLSRIALNHLPTIAAEPPAAGTSIDPLWLEVIATVRTPLARLEAFQRERELHGESPFAVWSNRPGDPWQVDLGPPPRDGFLPTTRLLVFFGPDGVLTPGTTSTRVVALAVLDSWGEVIPSTAHATTAAFHFDASGARAPQAILIAVPPDPQQPLDTPTLVDIVAETRELAHARATTIEELGDWSTAVPLTTLPANTPSDVPLDRV